MADLTAKMILELVDRLSGPAKIAARRMSALTRSATKMAKSFERMTEGSRKARKAIRQLGADAKKLPARAGAGRGRRGRGGITEEGIWQRGTMASAGHEMTRFARTSATVLLAPIKVMARFSEQMSKVAADTRKITKEEFEALRQKAKEIGETTRFTATEAGRGMHFLAKASFTAQQQMEGIDHVMNLAAAGAIEIGRASDIATDIMMAFGMEAKELGRVADVLATASTMATTDINQLGNAFSKVAPVARQYGLSFEETAAFVAAFASMGLKSGPGGRNLKRILTSLAAPSKQAKKELRSLRIEGQRLKLTDAAGEMRRPVEIFRDMAKAMKDMPGGERLKKMHRIFQAFGMVGAGGAVEQFAKAMEESTDEVKVLTEIEKILNASLSETGAAADKAATRMNNLMGDWIKTESATEGLALAIAESLNEDLRALLKDVTKSIQSFAKFATEHKILVKWVLRVFAAFVGLTWILGQTAIAVSVLIRAVKGFQDLRTAGTFAKIGGAANKAGGAIGSLVGRFGALAVVGYLAYEFGRWADETWRISDQLAGLNRQLDQFGNLTRKVRGGVAKLGTLSVPERARLGAAKEELEAAKEKRRQEKATWGWALSEGAFNAISKTDERIASAMKTIEDINRAGREREIRREREGYGPGFVGPTQEMGLKIKVESDVPVRTKVDVESATAGINAMIENLGLQGAGG